MPVAGYLLKNWRFNRKCLWYSNRIWGITLNSLLQVYRKLPYPIPVALGIQYHTCSIFNNGYGTVPADTLFKLCWIQCFLAWLFAWCWVCFLSVLAFVMYPVPVTGTGDRWIGSRQPSFHSWCLQIFVLSTFTSRLEHSVCWSPP